MLTCCSCFSDSLPIKVENGSALLGLSRVITASMRIETTDSQLIKTRFVSLVKLVISDNQLDVGTMNCNIINTTQETRADSKKASGSYELSIIYVT